MKPERLEVTEAIREELEAFHTFLCDIDYSLSKALTDNLTRKVRDSLSAKQGTVRLILGRERKVSAAIREWVHQIINIEEKEVGSGLAWVAKCPECGLEYQSVYLDLPDSEGRLHVGICHYCRSLHLTASRVTD